MLLSPGYSCNTLFTEVTVQSSGKGMTIVLVSLLFCSGLDHFNNIVAPKSEKNMSPLHKCRDPSKVATEWGNKLDNLKMGKQTSKVATEWGNTLDNLKTV